MKKSITALACMLALALSVTGAQATSLTTASTQYLGYIVPGLPSGEGNEESFINALIALAPNGSVTPCGNGASEENTCYRSENEFGALPAAVFVDKPTGTGETSVNVSGFSYLLAKYGSGSTGNVSHVWYVAGLTDVELPSNVDGSGGISHTSRFTVTTTTVPDGGTTLMLLGSAMVGLAALRRRFSL